MKVILLLAFCGQNILTKCVKNTTNILKELEIEVERIELMSLPYFTGVESPSMQRIKTAIEQSKGVIAVSSIHTIGNHGAMQSFMDHMSLYPDLLQGRPLFSIQYSEWTGERDACNQLMKAWEVLGGVEAGRLLLNQYAQEEEVLKNLEKSIEGFYRMLKQERPPIFSSEHYLYTQMKALGNKASFTSKPPKEKPTQMKSLVDILEQEEVLRQESQTKELTKLIASEEESFIEYGTYGRPDRGMENKTSKKLQVLPHYFVAQHDKSLDMTIQYILTDTQEEGFLTLKEGDCIYEEGKKESPSVEIALTQKVLEELLAKTLTYQKAFMLGKIKVRGNFVVLPKLDQIFKKI